MLHLLYIYLLAMLFYLPLTIFYVYQGIKDAHKNNTFTVLGGILHAITCFMGCLLLSPIGFSVLPYVQLIDRLKRKLDQ